MKGPIRALALLLLGACGDSGGDASLDSLPAAFGKTICQKIYSCCSVAERMDNPLIGKDAQSCQGNVAGFLTLVIPQIKDSVAKGRAVYHPDKMSTCLAQLDAQSCEQARATQAGADLAAVCEGAFEPKVAAGGECSDDGDCIAGWCDGANDPKLGKCAAQKADGASCVDDAECTKRACNGGTCGAPPTGGAGSLCQ
jgi:hypothetical protein